MYEPHLYFLFVIAVTVLMLIPGPNVALIVANSIGHGTRYGLLTVAGTSSAMVVQLSLTALGMTELLTTFGSWIEWLRWVGVAYLLYLGVQHWREPATDPTNTKPEPKSPRAIFARAFLVSLTNPKTLLFYGAFFPQFVTSTHSPYAQFGLLSATFLVIAILVDGGWAIAAGRARALLGRYGRLRSRLTGGALIAASVALATARNGSQ